MKDVLFHIKEGKIAFQQGKDILVLAPKGDRTEVNEATLTALLNAIKLEIDRVQVHYFNEPIHQIPLDATIVLIFGLTTDMLGNINLRLHKPLHLEGTVLLGTYSLNQLAEDKAKKMKLWQVLQATFLK